MKKKILITLGAIVVILVAYLFGAHHYIYARMGSAHLPAADITHQYLVGSAANNGQKLVYSALGDSLTAGVGIVKYQDSYPYLIGEKIAAAQGKDVDLRVQAYPGARTSDIIRDLLPPAISNQPDIVTLLVGVNDIHGFVSQIKFAENYQEILTKLKSETKARIYAISIPYVGADSLLLPPFNWYFRYETIQYNKIIQKIAQADNVEYIDLYTPTANMYQDPASYAADLFHPSAKGYGLWADIIYADINH